MKSFFLSLLKVSDAVLYLRISGGLFPLPDSDSDLNTDSCTMQADTMGKGSKSESESVWNPNPSPAVEMSHYSVFTKVLMRCHLPFRASDSKIDHLM